MSKQHSKVDKFYHKYKISQYLEMQSSKKITLNGQGMLKVLDQKAFRLKKTKSVISSNLTLEWSEYGDLWATIKKFENDSVVYGLPFHHTIVVMDGNNYLLLIYSKTLKSHRVIMGGGKEVNRTLRISYYPNNIYFPLGSDSIYNPLVLTESAEIVDNTKVIKVEPTKSVFIPKPEDINIQSASNAYWNWVGSDREGQFIRLIGSSSLEYDIAGFYIKDVISGESYVYTNTSFVVEFPVIANFVYCPFIRKDNIEYRGKVSTFREFEPELDVNPDRITIYDTEVYVQIISNLDWVIS